MREDIAPHHSAFRFHGSWQEYARIAFPNLLLTIVTLGIYRFWATTREREYLWSKTDFIDERLEWTGRGRCDLRDVPSAVLPDRCRLFSRAAVPPEPYILARYSRGE